jgi:hypothetical protein
MSLRRTTIVCKRQESRVERVGFSTNHIEWRRRTEDCVPQIAILVNDAHQIPAEGGESESFHAKAVRCKEGIGRSAAIPVAGKNRIADIHLAKIRDPAANPVLRRFTSNETRLIVRDGAETDVHHTCGNVSNATTYRGFVAADGANTRSSSFSSRLHNGVPGLWKTHLGPCYRGEHDGSPPPLRKPRGQPHVHHDPPALYARVCGRAA